MGCESPSQTSPPSGLENRLRKLTVRHVFTHESRERAEGYSCLTGVGRDCSWHVQRLSGASVNTESPQRISRLCFCHHHTESSSVTPSNPTAKPDPHHRGFSQELITREFVFPPGYKGKTSISGKSLRMPSSGREMRNCALGSESYYPSRC